MIRNHFTARRSALPPLPYTFPHTLALIAATFGIAACTASNSTVTAPRTMSATSSVADRVSAAATTSIGDNVAAVFGHHRRMLIADQFNNRVIAIQPSGEIVWSFGRGPNDLGPTSILGVNDAQPIGGGRILMAGTGVPAGAEPGCPSGCADNRVIIVDHHGTIVWQYGQFGITGSGPNELNAPVQSTYLPNGHVLITDQGNARVIEVTPNHKIVWQYGTTGAPGLGPDSLNNPNSAELLENGHILIADEANNRAIEVTRGHAIVATFTGGGSFSGVAFASRLSNGHTLITDSNNNRIVEVTSHDAIVWQYVTNTQPGSNANPLPTRAVRLATGYTLISDQFNHRVIAVDHAGHIAATYGILNQLGYGTDNTQQGLNAPYDAKLIGDFTGLTAPKQDGNDDGDDPR